VETFEEELGGLSSSLDSVSLSSSIWKCSAVLCCSLDGLFMSGDGALCSNSGSDCCSGGVQILRVFKRLVFNHNWFQLDRLKYVHHIEIICKYPEKEQLTTCTK